MSTTYTQYYNLGKQEDHADKFDMSIITENADKLDAALHAHDEEIAEVETAEAADRAALVELVDGGSKNRLTFNDLAMIKQQNTGGTWTGNVYEFRGVTYTINSDFSITATGTATGGNANLILSPQGGFSIEEGQWVLSGCPAGGSSSTYNIAIAGTVSDIGSTAEFSSCDSVITRIYIIEGTTVDDLTFRPMVCSKAAWAISQTYQPYRPSYAELYAMVQALQGGASLSSVQSTAQLASISAGDSDADIM